MEKRLSVFSEIELFQFINQYCEEGEFVKREYIGMDINSGGFRYIPDLYLPKGCRRLQLKEKTIIEVKTRVSRETLEDLRRISDLFSSRFREKGYTFLCVIMDGSFEMFDCQKQMGVVGRLNEWFKIVTYDELKRIAAGSEENEKPLTDDDLNKNIKANARKSFLTRKYSLILGAGVSIDAGLPSWDELMKRLIKQCRKNRKSPLEGKDYHNILKDCGSSSIILGRLIQTLFDDNVTEFNNAIKHALYGNKTVAPGTLAKTIGKMVKNRLNSVNGIITYNYDDLIEKALNENGVQHSSVYGNSDQSSVLPIYHVHGYLPQESNPFSPAVLSEKEYHDIYRRSFHWSNVEQLHAMQRSSCFFIGLSMTDPNLRRLLDIAQEEGNKDSQYRDIRHFSFLNKNDAANGLKGEKANYFRLQLEQTLKDFGVGVIWYDNYNELPTILDKIMSVK